MATLIAFLLQFCQYTSRKAGYEVAYTSFQKENIPDPGGYTANRQRSGVICFILVVQSLVMLQNNGIGRTKT